MRSIAVKHLAAIGALATLRQVFVEQTQRVELVDDHLAKVEKGTIADVRIECLGHRGEEGRDLGTDLVTLDRDARTDEGVHRSWVLEVAQGAREYPAGQSPPTGVHDAKTRRRLVDQEKGHAVGDQYRQGEAGQRSDQTVALQVFLGRTELEYFVAVDLASGDQMLRVYSARRRYPLTIFSHVLGTVADVRGEVERVVGRFAYPTEAVGDEGVNLERAYGFDRIDAEWPASFGAER